MTRPTVLFHATTPKKAANYFKKGRIDSPVVGYSTMLAAMEAVEGRKCIFLGVTVPGPDDVHKIMTPHGQFGCAWWIDADVTEWHTVKGAVPFQGEPKPLGKP